MNKPPIVEIVRQYVELRRAGKEYLGLCPFHSEKTPSFTVNEGKGLFYCFGCGTGGDVIRFGELIEGVSFKEAVARLGLQDEFRPKPVDTRKRRAAEKLAIWLNDQHLKVGILLRELSQGIGIAEQIPDPNLVASLTREWEILSFLHEDLQSPESALELLQAKNFIEAITAWAEPEPLPVFPPLTQGYRAYLRSLC